MLSGEFDTVSISFPWVDRSDRIRKVVTEEAILEKMESIARIGLIHAPVIKRDGRLISGETRFLALQRLGWTQIPVQWADTLDEETLLSIELEENIKRTDLPWQDQCDALLRFHNLKSASEAGWTQEQTAEAIGLSRGDVSKKLAVAKELSSGNARVVAAKELSVAVGITQRQTSRRAADELSLLKIGDEDAQSVEVRQSLATSPILTASFLEWVQSYSGAPFNLLHCDFPYGINADKFNQGAADSFGGYADTPETYWSLVEALIRNRDKLLGNSGHIIFWYSMRYHTETLAALREYFWVDPYPLVWHKSDNKGTLPDPQRGPRRVYEVAFFCSYGDRKIISPVSNTYSAPTVRLGEHMSEKSEDMLKHFMRMVVDENTRLLDPTCGSGSALRAARALGAGSVTGLEINPEFAENARRAFDAPR